MLKQCFLLMFRLTMVLGCFGLQANHGSDLVSKIDRYLQNEHDLGNLNGNVLMALNGSTLYKKSFGFADGSRTLALNEDYRFGIGSIYKEFPAVAIMQLKEKGRLELTDPLSKFLPELPSWAHEIQIEHLLQYTAGLPRVRWGAHKNINDGHIQADLESLESLNFAPGSDYLYTNLSPILLMKVVSAITKEPFPTYAQKNLFAPYGVKNMVIKNQYPYRDRTLMALPFNGDGAEDTFKVSISSLLFSATTADLVHWLDALHSFKIISKASVDYLARAAALEAENRQAPLGNGIFENGNMVEHSHHGSSGNYEGLVRYFPEEALSMVILTNRKKSNLFTLTEEIRRILRESD